MAKREEFAQSNKLFCFDTLFAMNAIGIVEKIFLSLDRVSLERCHFVSRAWSDVLSSDVFQRKKATLSKKMWMNTENLKHQLWVRHDRLPLYWAANSNEVAYFDLHMGMEPVYDLNYIGNDGELKTAPLHSEGSLWILNNTVLVVGGSCIYFFNKESMVSSTLQIPSPSYSSIGHSYDGPYTQLKAAFGVSVAMLPIQDTRRSTNWLWLGQISMDHRQECEWTSDFDEDFITDKDGCCYFARIDIGNLTVANYCYSYDCYKPAWNEDGTRFIFRGPEDESQLYVFALDRENSRQICRTGLTPLSEIPMDFVKGIFGSPPLIYADSRFLFIMNSDGKIEILNLADGSVVKTLRISQNDVWFYWNKITSTEMSLNAFLPSPPPHIEWNHGDQAGVHEDNHDENSLDPDLVTINLDTFDMKTYSVRESREEKLLVREDCGILEGKSVLVVPKCYQEGNISKIKLCHLDLRARTLFDGRNVTMSTVPFGADLVGQGEDIPWIPGSRFEPIPGRYVFRISALTDVAARRCIKRFREVCTGAYVIEYIVPTTRSTDPNGHVRYYEEGDGPMMHFIEVVSWKTEELPRPLEKLLNNRFQSN